MDLEAAYTRLKLLKDQMPKPIWKGPNIPPDVDMQSALKIMASPEYQEASAYVREHDPALWDYNERYLRSNHWQKIKRRVMKRDGKICKRCGRTANDVHHRIYDDEVLRGNNDEMLVSLCRECHQFISRDKNGKKRPPEEQEQLLNTPPEPELLPPTDEIPPISIRNVVRTVYDPNTPAKKEKFKAAEYPKAFQSPYQELQWLLTVRERGVACIRRGRGRYSTVQSQIERTENLISTIESRKNADSQRFTSPSP